ncbi:uncharacterized protein N7506_008226 [Penicillium brevicompactum]|uniref:uncharacterized protein n=1 Tax=Penicillium brevicompactum TaxID=5074 RepID=UPI002540FC50|nr:uncharacterized protein N7506_008226 [Penicillium brevicompactum]KAJ5325124.1 hypothetical protein N7506_008226 [Penicillium brevicompactum]
MSSSAVKAPPKLDSKAGTPTKARKSSDSSVASKPSTTAQSSAKTLKKPTPRKLSHKAPKPIENDVEEQSIPETPSPKQKKRSEQRRPVSSADDASVPPPLLALQSPSAAPPPHTTSDTANQGSETVQNGTKDATHNLPMPLDLSALKGLEVAEGGEILGQDGNPIGKVVEGAPEDLIGQTVGDDGEIIDQEGDLIGRVDILYDVADQAKDAVPEEAQSKLRDIDLENVVTDLAQLDGLPVSDGGVIKNAAGQIVGRIVEGDPEDLIGYTLNDDGEVVDEDGDAIGRVDLIPVEEQKKATKEATGDVTDKVYDAKDDLGDQYEDAQDGLPTDQAKSATPVVDEEVDAAKSTADDAVSEAEDAGSDVGDVNAVDVPVADDAKKAVDGTVDDAKNTAEETAQDAAENWQQRLPDLSTLEGLRCNKRGYIINQETGQPVGELTEGDPKKIAKLGATLDDKGQFWDNRGNLIGKAKTLPIEDDEDDKGPFSGLEGLVVGKDGFIEDENFNCVGRLVESDAKKLSGRGVDEDGDILDRKGNVIGRAELLEPEEELEEAGSDVFAVNGLSCNKAGFVIGLDGYPIACVVEDNPKKLASKKIEDGDIYNGKKVVSRIELIPDDELDSRPEGVFAGIESLYVTKDRFIENNEGFIVGELIEGDAKKLCGRAVDEDGEITDKYGNVKGRVESYEVPEEEKEVPEMDLSILEGKIVNKTGNVVNIATDAVVGRIVEGDKRLVGRKVDGPFYGFGNVTIGKDGVVQDSEKIIDCLIEGDAKSLFGRKVDEDGDVVDKNENTIGKAERWEPKEKKRYISSMSGCKVNKEGEVRDVDSNLIGKLTDGNLATLVGKVIDDNGYIVDNEGNKIGECILFENISEPEPELEVEEEGPTLKICKQIIDDELDEEKLVQKVKPLLEEGGRILQECNGSIRALDPDGRIAATVKARAASRDATPEEYQLADKLKELTETVVKTIDNGKKRIAVMPHAKKKLNPLWALLSEPLFQIIAAVGLLLTGVLGLVGRLLGGLGLGGLLNGLLGSLALDKLINGLGLGSLTDALGLGKK